MEWENGDVVEEWGWGVGGWRWGWGVEMLYEKGGELLIWWAKRGKWGQKGVNGDKWGDIIIYGGFFYNY